jgi:hypothetical protein
MAFFRNEAPGARSIRKIGGGYVTIDAGQTAEVARHLVMKLPPGLVEVDEDGEVAEPVPEIPADVADLAKGETVIPSLDEVLSAEVVEAPEVSMALTKAELVKIAKAEKVGFETDDNKADLVRKINAARK